MLQLNPHTDTGTTTTTASTILALLALQSGIDSDFVDQSTSRGRGRGQSPTFRDGHTVMDARVVVGIKSRIDYLETGRRGWNR